MRARQYIVLFLVLCFFLCAFFTCKNIIRNEEAPVVTVSPRFPLSANWYEFDNGEESTIHLEEK